MRMGRWKLFLLCVVGSLQGIIQTSYADQVTLKISLISQPGSPKAKACKRFKELVEKESAGDLRVEVHTSAELYQDREELEALRLNAVQMVIPSLSKLGPLGVPEFDVVDIPYLFDTLELAHFALDGKLGNALFGKLESQGIKGLAYWDLGFKGFHSKVPLKSVGDFAGKRVRVQKTPAILAEIKALGGIPVPTNVAKYLEGVRDGTLDAGESPVVNYMIGNLHEYHPYYSLTNHGYYGYAVVMNLNFWKSLSPKLQKIVEKNIKQVTSYERDLALKETEETLGKMRANPKIQVVEPSETDRAQIKQKLAFVKGEFEGRFGANWTQF